MKKIEKYIQNDNRKILSIVGDGGTGKSSSMAKAIQEAQVRVPKAQIVYRFIGATPGSSDGRNLLFGLCQELTRRFGGNKKELPADYRDLIPLKELMRLATREKPLNLFLIPSISFPTTTAPVVSPGFQLNYQRTSQLLYPRALKIHLET